MVEPTASVPVEFTFGIFHPAVEPAFVIQPQTERMRVGGSFRTPCHPYNATASAEVSERTLVLRVTGKATGECPQDAVISVAYQADVQVASSAYSRLRVIHEWRDAKWPTETVIDTVFASE
jgi:hypothetical protein